MNRNHHEIGRVGLAQVVMAATDMSHQLTSALEDSENLPTV